MMGREAPRPDSTWEDHAACRLPQHADVDWFPGKGDSLAVQRAKAVCATCPVRQACLEAHIAERFGIWGGLSQLELRAERRRRGGLRSARPQNQPQPIRHGTDAGATQHRRRGETPCEACLRAAADAKALRKAARAS